MKNTPKLTVGALTWTATISQRPWTPAPMLVGGSDESTAGVKEAWVDRTDYTLELRLRCLESEWPTLRAVLVYAQANAAVMTFWPDSAVAGTSFSVYLESPAVGEAIRPDRGEFVGSYEIAVMVRTSDGAALEPSYY